MSFLCRLLRSLSDISSIESPERVQSTSPLLCKKRELSAPRGILLKESMRDYVVLLLVAGLWVREATYDRPWAAMAQVKDGSCLRQRCGDIEVRYPFVLNSRSACPSFNATAFGLDCGSDGVLRINLTTDGVQPKSWQVLKVTEDSLFLNITEQRSIATCSGANSSDGNVVELTVPDFPSPYMISGDNKLVNFGCTGAVLVATHDLKGVQVGGCAAPCAFSSELQISPNPACGNRNCCFSAFPTTTEAIRGASYQVQIFDDSSPHPCSNVNSSFCIAFSPNFTNISAGSTFALKLSWALPDARLLLSPFSGVRLNNHSIQDTSFFNACSSNSSAKVMASLPGYHCSCLPGFEGDGYAAGRGCQDIDECRRDHDCVNQSTCVNTNGGYVCRCNGAGWRVGDGRRSGSGCKLSSTLNKLVASIGGIVGFAILLLALICVNMALHKRRKRNYFLQNGGAQLQQYLSAVGTTRETTRFFTAEELKSATQNFSDQLKLGVGGFGTVYKGTLKGGRVVAVKKANRGDVDIQQFNNELAILTQINHKHIVRLLGCCLETSTPLLVYEFVSNGNLAQNLASEMPMNWDKRLQIAIQTAEALAYLHAAACPPILHRDVKAANILLDDKLDAKLADFGVSRLIPDGQEHVSTAVQGTIGYLDPEYFQTLQLTDRSDVYSLGVVMVELVTGLKPVDNSERETRFANLAMLFIDILREKRMEDLIDARLEDLEVAQASILAVARLAQQCLSLKGAERPSMRQVVEELHDIAAKASQDPDGLGHENDDKSPLLPLDI